MWWFTDHKHKLVLTILRLGMCAYLHLGLSLQAVFSAISQPGVYEDPWRKIVNGGCAPSRLYNLRRVGISVCSHLLYFSISRNPFPPSVNAGSDSNGVGGRWICVILCDTVVILPRVVRRSYVLWCIHYTHQHQLQPDGGRYHEPVFF